jgi:tRNA(fMet)-specific endonuclease VapC
VTLRYLLDTSVVSAPIAPTPAPSIVKRLATDGHRCAIAAPVWHELTYGARDSARFEQLEVEQWSGRR